MNDIIHLAELGVDKDLKPLPTSQGDINEQEHFKVAFTPEFKPIEHFRPNQYTCASLTEKTISIIGRRHVGTEFYQVGIVMPRDLQNGTYPVVASGEGVSCTVITDKILPGHNGTVTFTKDEESITAEFKYQINYLGSLYNVTGKLYLLKTGPL